MFVVKPHPVEKKESSTETDEGLGSSTRRCGSGSQGSGSLHLSDSQDWALSPDEPPGLHGAVSPSLADETFRYMTYLALEPSSHPLPDPRSLSKVLSADRVEQMTRTYNDFDAVRRRLAERDRDLKLAARIGQSLLQRNNLLHERNEEVEEQLNLATDQVNQLQHELAQKDELLRMVASMSDESESDCGFSAAHPLLQQRHRGDGASSVAAAAAATAAALSQLEVLQGKLLELEEENQALRLEASHLKTETVCYEEKEQRLVSDCVTELREANSQMVTLADELSHKGEEVLRRQEEIAQLLSQIVELQHHVKELALEKEELRIHLQASKDAQRALTAELNELTERNAECLEMLHESQEEIKELRSKSSSAGGLRRHLSYGLYPMDSLAAEIEGTMRKELSVDEESAFQAHRTSQKRVFQTVRSVNALPPPPPPRASAIPGSGPVMTALPFQSAQGEETTTTTTTTPPQQHGAVQLADAVRLSLRRHNVLSELKYFEAEQQRKMEALRGEEEREEGGGGSPAFSGRSSFSNLSELSSASGVFKTFLPEKLQIVKPMEGSLTLHHWQQLAQPHLASLLDPHPGVVTRGFRPLSQDCDPAAAAAAAAYCLDDPEEDEAWAWGAPPAAEEEKGSIERGKANKKDDEEEEEVEVEEDGEEDRGIVFKVRVSSTPEDRRERARLPGSPLAAHADTCSPFRPLAAVGAASFASMIRADPTAVPAAAAVRPAATPTPALLTPALLTPALLTPTLPTHALLTLALPTPALLTPALPTPALPTSAALTSATPGPVQSEAEAVAPMAAPAALSSVPSPCAVQHPGKCQSSTFSTNTVTTCRILHPNDLAQVTSSSQSMWSVSAPHTPSSMRTGPSTPVTPCRLNLGGAAPDPHPPRLAKLVAERGISARRRPAPRRPTAAPGSPPAAAAAAAARRRPAGDIFLASRPAELFLQDVYGLNLGRAPPHPDLPSPAARPPHQDAEAGGGGAEQRADPVSVGLVEWLRRLGFGRTPQGPPGPSPAFVAAAGGGGLLEGLRRNQSLPVMMGAPTFPPSAPPASLALRPPSPPWGEAEGGEAGR